VSRADEILDGSETREEAYPLAALESSVEWGELRKELSGQALEALKVFAKKAGPALLALGAEALESLAEREIARRL
jgi:hypothetical protein